MTAKGLGIYRILLTYAGRHELAGLVEVQLGPALRRAIELDLVLRLRASAIFMGTTPA